MTHPPAPSRGREPARGTSRRQLGAGVGDRAPPGGAARDAVRDAGGLVLGHRLLTPEELVVFGIVVGDEIEFEAAEAAADDSE